MGAAESRPSPLGGHEALLEVFVGSKSRALHDPFWDNLLSFSYALPKMKPEDFDEATREACTTLALNNRQSFHFGKLLVHMVKSLGNVPDVPSELPLKAVNTVYFTRLFVKHLVEYYEPKEVWEQLILNVSPEEAEKVAMDSSLCTLIPNLTNPGRHDLVVPVVRALLTFSSFRDVNMHSYLLHLEVINLLLVMCSTQLHGSSTNISSEAQLFIEAAMAQDDLAGPFIRKLLVSFIAKRPLPPRVPYYIPMTARQGVIRRLGSAAVAVFLLPYYTYNLFMSNPSSSHFSAQTPLADNSLLLLLVLIHYGRVMSLPSSQGKQGGVDQGSRDRSSSSKGREGAAGETGGDVEEELMLSAEAAPLRPIYHPNPFKDALCLACDSAWTSTQGAAGEEQPLLSDREQNPSSNISEEAAGGGGGSGGTAAAAAASEPWSRQGQGRSGRSKVEVPFPSLYDSLGSSLNGDSTVLLLYSLVHANPLFLDYCLVRSDLDTLLLPLLELLYQAPKRTANEMYMLLIILLILSQDSSFNANVHKVIIPSVPWYKERLLKQVSLGSLMVIILIRTVKFNLSRLRDVYLHTNCLATLANMAPHVHNLNAYASQRLVSLFQMLAKRYTKLSQSKLPEDAGSQGEQKVGARAGGEGGEDKGKEGREEKSGQDREREGNGLLEESKGDGAVGREDSVDQDENSASSEHQSLMVSRSPSQSQEGGAMDAPSELSIYTDFLRIVLEIINAILTFALPRNPEFVYALLHRQELFLPFRNEPRFYELLENIFTVIEFFNVRMDDKIQEGEWSVEKVLQIIVSNARMWRGDGMQMFTELKFTYEEEVHPEEFFVPYVWTLVVAKSGIPWNPECITMFPVRPATEHLEDVYDQDAFDTHSELGKTPKEDV